MSAGPAPSPSFGEWETRQARLEERVSGLEGDVRTVLTSVQGLGDKLDRDRSQLSNELSARSKTNWGLVATIVGLAMTGTVYLGSQWREPIVQRQEAMSAEIVALRQAVVPRAEVQGLVRQGERDNDLIRQRIERFETRIGKEVEHLNTTVFVPAWSKRS